MEPVRIRSGRQGLLGPFLGSLAFVAGSVWAISTGGPVHIVVGVVGIVFFGLGVVRFSYHLVVNPVVLQIDDEGYLDRSSLATPGRILWSEVGAVAIRSVGPERFLEIKVRDPEDVLRRASPLRRAVMRANRKFGFETVTIPENMLPYPLETLIETMQKRNPGPTVLPPA